MKNERLPWLLLAPRRQPVTETNRVPGCCAKLTLVTEGAAEAEKPQYKNRPSNHRAQSHLPCNQSALPPEPLKPAPEATSRKFRRESLIHKTAD